MAKKSESETVHSDIEKLAREFGRSKVANEEHREKLRAVGFPKKT